MRHGIGFIVRVITQLLEVLDGIFSHPLRQHRVFSTVIYRYRETGVGWMRCDGFSRREKSRQAKDSSQGLVIGESRLKTNCPTLGKPDQQNLFTVDPSFNIAIYELVNSSRGCQQLGYIN